jgi:hypothetical protein
MAGAQSASSRRDPLNCARLLDVSFFTAFMAITSYFIDKNLNYREILLGFEPLYGSHTGTHLSETVVQILTEHGVVDRVSSITTDNASNNNTMMNGVQEAIPSRALGSSSIFRVPCIAHVIQLCLNELLGKLRVAPLNKEIDLEWSDGKLEDHFACTQVEAQGKQAPRELPQKRIPDVLDDDDEDSHFLKCQLKRIRGVGQRGLGSSLVYQKALSSRTVIETRRIFIPINTK